MRELVSRALRDGWPLALAFAIALGWSLWDLTKGVGTLVAGLLYEGPSDRGTPYFFGFDQVLRWSIGDSGRVLLLGPLIVGIVEVAFVLGLGLLVWRFRARARSN